MPSPLKNASTLQKKRYSLNEKDYDFMAIIFIMVAFAYHILFTIKTPYDFSPHDMGYLVGDWEAYGEGHLGYMEYLLKYSTLPRFNPSEVWGFYNPPFFYLCSATLWKLLLALGIPYVQCLEWIQFLPCLCITVATFGGFLLLKECRIGGFPRLLMTAVLSFFPAFSYLSCTLNNDAMSYMFSVLALYFALRWYHQPKTAPILLSALCIGLGMLTKLSAVLVAPPIAVLFLCRFFREKKKSRIFLQFSGFALIAFPLGLYWPIRNAIKYQLPLAFVQALPENSVQKVADCSLWQRLGFVPLTEFLRPWTYFSPSDAIGHPDCNVWTQLFRSAFFDDNILFYTDNASLKYGKYFLLLGVVLMLALFIFSLFGSFQKKRLASPLVLSCLVGVICNLVSYIKFSMDYPVTCSMHFRYIPTLLLFVAIGWGFWATKSARLQKSLWLKLLWLLPILLFCIFSALLYLRFLPSH